MKQTQHIKEFLTALGLDEREIRVIICLLSSGVITTLELARATKIPRTTLYRLISDLRERGVVEEVVDEYVSKIQMAPLTWLEYLVKEKKQQADTLGMLLPEMQMMIGEMHRLIQPETKVRMYRGQDGIRQMIWNVLDARSEVVGYTYRDLDEFAGARFMRRFREEFEERGLAGRDIITDTYLKSIDKNTSDWKCWQSRYVLPDKLMIEHQMDIYNDIVAIYNWHEGEVFGVEIANAKVATMQRQIFELVWGVGDTIDTPKSS